MTIFLNYFFDFLQQLLYSFNSAIGILHNDGHKIFNVTLFNWLIIFASISFFVIVLKFIIGGDD